MRLQLLEVAFLVFGMLNAPLGMCWWLGPRMFRHTKNVLSITDRGEWSRKYYWLYEVA